MVYTIPRSSWGAQFPDGFGSRPMPITEFWFHHSVTIAPDLKPPFTDDDAAVRLLEKIGQQRFGGGISYTYPVTPVGRLYQGHSDNRRGAHTKGHNTVGAAFCVVGDYSRIKPTRAQMLAIAEKMVELHRQGRATRHTLNGGHRDTFGTACPGDAAYAAIPEINRMAEELWKGIRVPSGGSGGSRKADVVELQRVLKLDADGIWGEETEKQVQGIRRWLRIGLTRFKWANGRGFKLRKAHGWKSPRDITKLVQRALGVTADGAWGPATDKALWDLRDATYKKR